ncbi:MAG: prepilin-type N-terminal cleavage/methylation domain-containing protein [Candidatus Competibacteraceae bacterium]|nr:prepilin-type N-terminal cleavage/methylation domain-containing protein [Candidatus Competibacteraceae bacterium]
MFRKPSRQSGFTLLSFLITLIVLSIGLLGLAGLQVVSLRNNHTAYLRTQAITQSYDMSWIGWANSGTMDDGSYDSATDTVTTGCTNAAADPLVVKIWWVDDRAGDPPVPSRFSTVIGDQL